MKLTIIAWVLVAYWDLFAVLSVRPPYEVWNRELRLAVGFGFPPFVWWSLALVFGSVFALKGPFYRLRHAYAYIRFQVSFWRQVRGLRRAGHHVEVEELSWAATGVRVRINVRKGGRAAGMTVRINDRNGGGGDGAVL